MIAPVERWWTGLADGDSGMIVSTCPPTAEVTEPLIQALEDERKVGRLLYL